MSIATDAQGLLQGVPFGEVEPPMPLRPLADIDPRTHALERFREYITLLDFSRTGPKDMPAIVYRLPKTSVHIEQPDEPDNLTMPAIAFLPGDGTFETFGLGPPKMLEDTADVYGLGLVLVVKHDLVEDFIIEVWGATRAERRSLVAGLTEALTAIDESYSTRLTLPAYFDQVAEFTLNGVRYIDDPDVIRGRRRAHVKVNLRVPEVQLVAYRPMEAQVIVETCDGQYEALLALQAKLAEGQAPQT